MKNYQELLQDILTNGKPKGDRTGTGTLSVFGRQLRWDLSEGFPLITTKQIHLPSVVHELLWMISGSTNTSYLKDKGIKIWDDWRRPWTRNRHIVQVRKKGKDHVDYNGDFSMAGCNYPKGSLEERLAGTWSRMMSRCYNKKAHNYRFYGEKGVSVAKRWHKCSNFVEDVQKLPHWNYKKDEWNNFELDKDYFEANQYGPDTCIWLHKSENIFADWLLITTPEGEELIIDGYSNAAKVTGLSRTTIHRFLKEGMPRTLKSKNKRVKGWKFEYANKENDLLYRYSLIDNNDLGPIYGYQWRRFSGVIDQLGNVIEQIKTDPYSRRHLISSWNPKEIKLMALPPCHYSFQFQVDGNKLNCIFNMRSTDVFLGLPFNIASYALLTHMIAQQCDLEVGELVYSGADVHIYLNHIEQVKEQLSREPYPLPQLHIKRKPESIDDYVYEDFEFIGYKHHPAIKAPVSV
ncbi:thymidylate synthase [Paenibacillus pabuli]|uniref:Thymidylate synthase n=2 Tax=Paenibacillus TaxID=44249 RepID=A0A855Y633_9BACL|nr:MULTISPECIES: thymidylate synthase [Paenibacillus]PWW37374.1 thymidylate synthase [Paenibacillus pabuli]PXW05516.1 thymidylate synthase [Paenibacillus taichungensis]